MCWGRGSMLGQLQRRVDRVVEMRQRRGSTEWSRETLKHIGIHLLHWLLWWQLQKLACSLRYINTAKVSSVCVCKCVSAEFVFGSLKGYCSSCKWGIWVQLSDVWNKATEVELRTWVEGRTGQRKQQGSAKGSWHFKCDLWRGKISYFKDLFRTAQFCAGYVYVYLAKI